MLVLFYGITSVVKLEQRIHVSLRLHIYSNICTHRHMLRKHVSFPGFETRLTILVDLVHDGVFLNHMGWKLILVFISFPFYHHYSR